MIIFRREIYKKKLLHQKQLMTKVPKYWNKAKRYLSKKDKIMSKLIKKYKSPSETNFNIKKRYFFLYVKV